ncbi:hypothetical protein J2Z48_001258 [Croceifilum oryzae]|uniref:ATP-binding protein n=1 Tax=Croceifilum oryzae TaxID=1553429 RepID=A0AAJ1WTK4_9BACL|nr:ATP-binding protein [Croceifilum oryzae]MDQ0417086.1 hypothetical protein [Croceifilum oryzae]
MITTDQFEIAIPDATPLIQSIRSIGYNLETAIADIVDNSIDANANIVKIDIIWNEGKSYIRIEDDGCGMNEGELVQAMRLGSKNPNEKRNPKDLGRFGMGLKTASFSIGKKLTVMTKQGSQLFSRCWDIDVIAETNQWTLLKEITQESREVMGDIQSHSGTVVLIEKLDKIVSLPVTYRKQKKFLRHIKDVEDHLQLVFHRFLESQTPITILLNNHKLVSWDPFLTTEMATQEMPEERVTVAGDTVVIQPYVLPHHSKLSKENYRIAGGVKGWFEQQGFYVYRNRRLLVAGGWLGLFSKEESYKLGRIKIDIGNLVDFHWQIDIKKSTARPPQELVDIFKKVGEKARSTSYKVFYYRGSYFRSKGNELSTEIEYVWEQVFRNGKLHFILNRHNLLFKKVFEAERITQEALETYLFYVQEYCPSNIISYAPNTLATGQIEKLQEIAENHKIVMHSVIQLLREQGISDNGIVNQILQFSDFTVYSQKSIEKLLKEVI